MKARSPYKSETSTSQNLAIVAVSVLDHRHGAHGVVKISQSGLVTLVDEGIATITLTVGGVVTLQCDVRVKSEPAELTGRGETSNILVVDFEEDKYTAGENALWND